MILERWRQRHRIAETQEREREANWSAALFSSQRSSGNQFGLENVTERYAVCLSPKAAVGKDAIYYGVLETLGYRQIETEENTDLESRLYHFRRDMSRLIVPAGCDIDPVKLRDWYESRNWTSIRTVLGETPEMKFGRFVDENYQVLIALLNEQNRQSSPNTIVYGDIIHSLGFVNKRGENIVGYASSFDMLPHRELGNRGTYTYTQISLDFKDAFTSLTSGTKPAMKIADSIAQCLKQATLRPLPATDLYSQTKLLLNR